jgi:kexin
MRSRIVALSLLLPLASISHANGLAKMVDVQVAPPPMTELNKVDPHASELPQSADNPSVYVVVTLRTVAMLKPAMLGDLHYYRQDEGDPTMHFFKADSPEAAVAAAARLQHDPSVVDAHVLNKSLIQPTWTPNDLLVPPTYPKATYYGQWHLYNRFDPGLDLNVYPVWANKSFVTGYTGKNMVVGNLEEGVVVTHLDLFANYNSTYAYDFVDGDNLPQPSKYSNNGLWTVEHGTSCAGLLAGVGNNGIGITGVAPEAELSPIRFLFSDPADEIAACKKYSTSPNNFFDVKTHSYGYEIPWYDTNDAALAMSLSESQGTIHTISAGNYRNNRGQDSGSKNTLGARQSIIVAALGSNGKYASYSNFGSNVFCTAPSSSTGYFGITTTDTPGESGYNDSGTANDYPNRDYTRTFGGTSAACPEVGGVMALAKQANSNLTPRMAQHLLVKTCKIIDPTDSSSSSYGGWRANAAGIKFNPDYGFGLIDAAAFVNAAKQYTGVTAEAYESSGVVSINSTLPDNNANGIQRSFTLTETQPLESIQLFILMNSERYNDNEVWVRSPQGYWSPLVRAFSTTGYTYGDTPMVRMFVTNAFWGQSPAGTWTVLLRDVISGKLTTITNFQVIWYHGELTGTVKSLHGTVNLGTEFVGGKYGVPGVMEFWNGGIFASKIHDITINEDGSYDIPSTIGAKTYDTVYLRVGHWLRARRDNITVSSSGALINWTLTNGDCDGNNYIGTDDYLILNSAFDSGKFDEDWDPRADLTGDGYVGTDDYLVLNKNFDKTGQ